MIKTGKTARDFYTEAEAADELNVSLDRLHNLLDRKVFNDGSTRPNSLNFQPADLLLLRFWLDQDPPKLIQMPLRRTRQGTGTDDFDRER